MERRFPPGLQPQFPVVSLGCYRCREGWEDENTVLPPLCPNCGKSDQVYTKDLGAPNQYVVSKSAPAEPVPAMVGAEPRLCGLCVEGVEHVHPANPGGDELARR